MIGLENIEFFHCNDSAIDFNKKMIIMIRLVLNILEGINRFIWIKLLK